MTKSEAKVQVAGDNCCDFKVTKRCKLGLGFMVTPAGRWRGVAHVMPSPTITTSCGMVMIHQPRRCPSAWLPSSWYLPAQRHVSPPSQLVCAGSKTRRHARHMLRMKPFLHCMLRP